MNKFSYTTIDEMPEEFYAGTWSEEGFTPIPNKKFQVNINGKPITVNIQLNRTVVALWNRYSDYIKGASEGRAVYDPIDVEAKFQDVRFDYYNGELDIEKLLEGSAHLSPKQIRTRVLSFVKVMQMVSDESIAEYIVQMFPKKKDGSLYLKRIAHIATLFCQREDLQMQEIYAQAKKDDELLISSHLKKHINTIDLDNDLIVSTNLFRDI